MSFPPLSRATMQHPPTYAFPSSPSPSPMLPQQIPQRGSSLTASRPNTAARHTKRLTLNVPVNPPRAPTTPDHSFSSPLSSQRRPSVSTGSVSASPLQSLQLPDGGGRAAEKGAAGEGDYNWLTAIASQERRVLELREELQRAERELVSLKRQWALSERARKKTEVDHQTAAFRTPDSATSRRNGGGIGGDGESPIATNTNAASNNSNENTPLSTVQAKMTRELERRNSLRAAAAAAVGGAALSPKGRRVFHGSHTRALSLLTPPAAMELKAGATPDKGEETAQRITRSPRSITLPSMSPADRERRENGGQVGSKLAIQTAGGQQQEQQEDKPEVEGEQDQNQQQEQQEGKIEVNLEQNRSRQQEQDERQKQQQQQEKQQEEKHCEQQEERNQQKQKEEEDLLTNLRNSVPRDMLVRTGKQMASDLREGLWTFLEDIRQATVGEEVTMDPRAKSPSARSKMSSGQHTREASFHGRLTSRSSSLSLRKSANAAELKPVSKSPVSKPLDVEDSFWSEFGVEAPPKSPTMSTSKAQRKATTPAQDAANSSKNTPTPARRPTVQPEMSLLDADDSWDGWDTSLPQPYRKMLSPALQTETIQQSHSPSSSRSTVESKQNQSPTTQTSSPRTSTRLVSSFFLTASPFY